MRHLLDNIPDMVWLKDVDGVYLSCNPAFERFFGATESEIAGRTDYDFLTREEAEFFRQKDKEAIAADGPRKNEEWITLAADGQRLLLETIKGPCGMTTERWRGSSASAAISPCCTRRRKTCARVTPG